MMEKSEAPMSNEYMESKGGHRRTVVSLEGFVSCGSEAYEWANSCETGCGLPGQACGLNEDRE
jgi:hypothetical protein